MSTENNRSNKTDAISLADEEHVKEVLVDSVMGLWDIVNNLTRLKPSRKERYRVTIFGSARLKPGGFAYEATRQVSAALAELGCDIITGGGPGLMQAANEGAATVPGAVHSMGIRVDLPFEQEVNSFVTQAFEHRTFFTRLHQFVLSSDAFVVAPGGIGTVLEAMMIWQLIQVRHLKDCPFIFVGKMWPGLVQWAKEAMLTTDPPLANAADMNIPVCASGPAEVITIIKEHRATWLAQQKQ